MGEEYGLRIMKPYKSAIEFLADNLKNKAVVKDFLRISEQKYKIVLKKGRDLIVYIVDAYVLGQGATMEIVEKNSDINAILVISSWDEYTPQAQEAANKRGVRIFTFNELMYYLYNL